MTNNHKNRKECPYCAETILASAKKCRVCGEWFEKEFKTKTDINSENTAANESKVKKVLLTWVTSLIIFIALLLFSKGDFSKSTSPLMIILLADIFFGGIVFLLLCAELFHFLIISKSKWKAISYIMVMVIFFFGFFGSIIQVSNYINNSLVTVATPTPIPSTSATDLFFEVYTFRYENKVQEILSDDEVCAIAQQYPEQENKLGINLKDFTTLCPKCNKLDILIANSPIPSSAISQWKSNTDNKTTLLGNYEFGCGYIKDDYSYFIFANKKKPITQKVDTRVTNSTVNQDNFVKDNDPWGVAKQIDEHTWTMKIGTDDRMGTPQEIFNASNIYRERKGVGKLEWNDNLASYAKERAQFFTKNGKLDSHAGFNDYVKNIDNLKKLGFWGVGENSSYGYHLLGVHLIEWVYAGDKPHDDNQINPKWSHVGIGVDGNQTDFIFGSNKM